MLETKGLPNDTQGTLKLVDWKQNWSDVKHLSFSSAKLLSCLDQMHSILGEACHEPTAVHAILKHNFDLERALDQILGGGQ